MLTKIGDSPCLKTDIGNNQGHALCKRQKALKAYLIKKLVKELAPSPRQILNGQGKRRIFGLQKFEQELEVFVEEVRKCVNR